MGDATARKTVLEHYDAAAAALQKIDDGKLTAPGIAAYAAAARAHLHAADLLLRIQQTQQPNLPRPQVILR